MTVLDVQNLTVDFHLPEGPLRAVDGVSFRMSSGKFTALVGESGSGKSVITQAIMGLLPRIGDITSGNIWFDDPAEGRVDIAALDRDSARMRRIRGDGISIVFQEPMTSLSPLHTVGDQVSEAVHLHRNVGKVEALDLTMEMLAHVGFPDPKRALRTYPFELSGGLRQRAMISMALVCRPALLIADEPTTALDVTIQAQILKLIRDLQGELNMSVLIITHDLGVVANVADEVVVAYHGKVMEAGAAQDIFNNPQHPYLKALLNAVPRFDMAEDERLQPIRPIEPRPGGFLTAAGAGKPDVAADKPLLEVDNITKTFTLRKSGLFGGKAGEVRALDGVSFTVNRGECLGLVGESGCGKTTASKIIMRALSPTSGSIRYDRGGEMKNVHELTGDALMDYRANVQFMFQDPFSSLNPRMTVYDILREPYVIHGPADIDEQFERAKQLMSLVGLRTDQLRRYPHSFSGGQRQRIGIARALALRPELILCDEPVSALDVSVQAQVLNLLKDMQSELGLTYIFVSHNLAVVDYIADRIAVMCQGRIVELAEKSQLVQNHIHPYTNALFSAVPEPNLDHPLNLTDLMEGRASDPAAWEQPYRIEAGHSAASMIEVEPGHFVCAPGLAQEAA